MSSVRVTGLVVDHLSALLSKVLRFEGPADAVMSRYFKQHPKLGSRDRSLVAEATFAALRHYGTLQWQMQPAHPARAHPVGRETILVVEDDSAVRKVAVRILRGLGYQVRESTDGPSALALLEQPGSIDLLFTDLIMPKGMSGQELLTRAHAIRPDLKALFTSGYSERFIKDKGATQEGVPLLSKPYRSQSLAEAVRAALDAAPHASR